MGKMHTPTQYDIKLARQLQNFRQRDGSPWYWMRMRRKGELSRRRTGDLVPVRRAR
jgi:hypothetical protein